MAERDHSAIAQREGRSGAHSEGGIGDTGGLSIPVRRYLWCVARACRTVLRRRPSTGANIEATDAQFYCWDEASTGRTEFCVSELYGNLAAAGTTRSGRRRS